MASGNKQPKPPASTPAASVPAVQPEMPAALNNLPATPPPEYTGPSAPPPAPPPPAPKSLPAAPPAPPFSAPKEDKRLNIARLDLNGRMTRYRVKGEAKPVRATQVKSPFEVDTPDGKVQGNAGDWVIQRQDGARAVLTDEQFKKIASPVEAPKPAYKV